MFEYAIRNLESLKTYIYELYGDILKENTTTAKVYREKIKELETAVKVLTLFSNGVDGICSYLLDALQGQNPSLHDSEVSIEQCKKCIQLILKALGIKRGKCNNYYQQQLPLKEE